MNKSIKTLLLGVFLISPIVLLILYSASTARKEAPKTNVNLSNLKLVTPVAIIDEITKKIVNMVEKVVTGNLRIVRNSSIRIH